MERLEKRLQEPSPFKRFWIERYIAPVLGIIMFLFGLLYGTNFSHGVAVTLSLWLIVIDVGFMAVLAAYTGWVDYYSGKNWYNPQGDRVLSSVPDCP
jgi:hypothetical protein